MVYQLDIPDQWKQKKIHPIFHASLLTPYHEMEVHGTNYEEPLPDIVNGVKEHEVEEILSARRTGQWKKKQYLIRWKGYSDVHDSWEPEEGVHMPALVTKFYEQFPVAI